MATSRKIKIMLSSRCNDIFSSDEKVSLTDIRRDLKREIESQILFGFQPFKVWINEDSEALDHSADSWDSCLQQVRDCDILIVLYNGNAGWAKTGEDVGICHAEYAEALKTSPGKVRFVELPRFEASTDTDQKKRDQRFAAYKNSMSAFRGGEIKTVADLNKEVNKAIFDAVLTQTRRGGEGAKAGRYDLGAALEWSRLDFAGRRAVMEKELLEALSARPDAKRNKTINSATIRIGDKKVLVKVHAVPAAFSVAAAREPVGRPHLQDHLLVSELGVVCGPLHIIACHRTVTENQATNLLGFPDATIINSPFGVYVADNVQKMQFVFLANCRDPVQTRLAVQRFWDWLEQSGESDLLAERASARSRIVKIIAKEQN